MTRVNVSSEILQWAAYRSGKNDLIQSEFPNWMKWINNESQPTFKQLENLAKATSTPLGYFFLQNPPKEQLPVPHYRTVTDRSTNSTSPNLLESVQTMQRRQEWMHDFLIQRGHDPLDFVGRYNANHSPKLIAEEIREKLGLKYGWANSCRNWQDALRMLLQKIEEIGILVVVNGIVGNNTHRKLNVQEFRGFVLVDKYAPLIFVNGSDGKAAQMFTLAHELAHIWFGASAVFDLQELRPADNEIEQACNNVAAEFLVPEAELIEHWNRIGENEARFQLIARQFKVSELVAARRAMDLQLISRIEFFDFYNNRFMRDLRVTSDVNGGNFYAVQSFRISRLFAQAVITATFEGKLLYREAYALTGIKGKTFAKFAASIGHGGEV